MRHNEERHIESDGLFCLRSSDLKDVQVKFSRLNVLTNAASDKQLSFQGGLLGRKPKVSLRLINIK